MVDDNYIHESMRVVAEEFHVLLSYDLPMKAFMFLANAARKQVEARVEAAKKAAAAAGKPA